MVSIDMWIVQVALVLVYGVHIYDFLLYILVIMADVMQHTRIDDLGIIYDLQPVVFALMQ